MKLYKFLFVVVIVQFTATVLAQNTSLDSIIKSKMQLLHMPGLAACTIDKGRITWTGYYGYQNIEQNIPVSSKTLFLTSSVGKTINAAAISQLIAEGKLHLDDDVNLYLPFKVRNPNFPDVSITLGQLLRHRSSIRDNLEYLQSIWDTSKGDSKIPLDVFLKDYLIPGGTHYDKQKNFLNTRPNTERVYCNIGFALLGYIVECVTKQSFDQYCKKNIFGPLDMLHTAFFLRDLDTNLIAMPYHYSDSLHQFIAYGQGGFPEYPAGLIRTPAEELAHFLIAWTSNGKWQNRQIFDSTLIQVFTPSDIRVGCYTWNIFAIPTKDKPIIMYGHTGGDNGSNTIMAYQPDDKKGFILFSNGDFNGRNATNVKNMLELVTAIYESISK
jgi:CubicO group peptidase (beta-lactamase class C family)